MGEVLQFHTMRDRGGSLGATSTVRRRLQPDTVARDKHLLVADTFTFSPFPRTPCRGVLPVPGAAARAIPSTLVRPLVFPRKDNKL